MPWKYLQIANSWPVWLCAGACVIIIVIQSVAFAKLCYKNAPLVEKYSSAGTKMVPTGSMCLSGLSVMRPSMLAVWSPKWRAA